MKILAIILLSLLLAYSAYGFVSLKGAIDKVNREGTEIEVQTGVKVNYIKLVTPCVGSEDRSYFVVFNMITPDKLIPVRFDIINENWSKDKDINVVDQYMITLDPSGNIHNLYHRYLYLTDDGQLLQEDNIKIEEAEGYDIVVKQLDLLLNKSCIL